MPIKLPNLDDRTFADLVAEAHTLIPVHAPEWTNHNESDPGITLVELFAYLSEIQIYRLNRVTDANVCAFLRLIDGVERKPSTGNSGRVTRPPQATEFALRDEVRDVVLKLRQQDRAVTGEDFERLALAADPRVLRAYCVPRRNLAADGPYEVAQAHMSVVIVSAAAVNRIDGDLRDLKDTVGRYLEPRRLLTTRVNIVGPRFVTIGVHVILHLRADAVPETVNAEARRKLEQFFNPLGDQQGHQGWPFGRNVFVSEIYRLLDPLPGVDFVTKVAGAEIVTAHGVTDERRVMQGKELVAVRLNPDELVNFSFEKSEISLIRKKIDPGLPAEEKARK
jgi:hypothetical protein